MTDKKYKLKKDIIQNGGYWWRVNTPICGVCKHDGTISFGDGSMQYAGAMHGSTTIVFECVMCGSMKSNGCNEDNPCVSVDYPPNMDSCITPDLDHIGKAYHRKIINNTEVYDLLHRYHMGNLAAPFLEDLMKKGILTGYQVESLWGPWEPRG